ncbi:hypothetical protein [Dactylosporangium sp. NPDC005555]|uniref:hypothetical protein n=1 Tax=Dactylosporangium sp. NPDC005555 TaxID=3154889 RepID=UPI00339F45A1
MSAAGAARHVGWLLRVNRRLGDDETLRSGRQFARAFRTDTTKPLAPSHVTRWENGDLAVTRATVRRYEHLLGLATDSLKTLIDAVNRVEGAPMLADDVRADVDQDRQRLSELLDRVFGGGSMTGTDWGRLTDLISARQELEFYPRHLWRDLADRLLGELVVAVGSAWLQRQEAMSRLLEHPTARTHAVAACIGMAEDLSTTAVIEPLSLLDVTADAAANRYVLRQISRPDSDRAMHGALLAAIRKVGLAHFRDGEWLQLAACLSSTISDPALDPALAPLAIDVARRLTRRLPNVKSLHRSLSAVDDAHRTWQAGRSAEPQPAQLAGRRIAARAQSRLGTGSGGADAVLAELIGETLFGSNPERRMVASMLLAASPYRRAVAQTLLDEITADIASRGQTYPLAASLRAITQLNVDIHRPLIRDILIRPGFPAAARHAAAWATPYCAGQQSPAAWRKVLDVQVAAWLRQPSELTEGIVLGIVHGIGTDGQRPLLAAIQSDPALPASARTAASWLMRTDVCLT